MEILFVIVNKNIKSESNIIKMLFVIMLNYIMFGFFVWIFKINVIIKLRFIVKNSYSVIVKFLFLFGKIEFDGNI